MKMRFHEFPGCVSASLWASWSGPFCPTGLRYLCGSLSGSMKIWVIVHVGSERLHQPYESLQVKRELSQVETTLHSPLCWGH